MHGLTEQNGDSNADRIVLLLSALGHVTYVEEHKQTTFLVGGKNILALTQQSLSTPVVYQLEAEWLGNTRCRIRKCALTYLCVPFFFAWLKRRVAAKPKP